jgi:putative nucleotidyltransferase with HDIG domain
MEKVTYILNFTDGPLKGKSLALSRQDYTIGRTEENSIRLGDKLVSKRHCKLTHAPEGLFITDLGSRNGTFLNGLRLQPDTRHTVPPGSEIEIGQSQISVIFDVSRTFAEALDEDETFDVEEPIRQKPGVGAAPEPSSGRFDAELGRTTIPFSIDSSRNLQAIYLLLNRAIGITDREALADQAMNIVMEAIKPERGYFFLREDLKEEAFEPRVIKIMDKAGKISSPTISRTVINKVLETGDSLLSAETPTDDRFAGSRSLVKFNINSIVCAPIKTKTKFHGIIYLDSTSSTITFKKDDIELLTAFGMQLGILLENLGLITDFRELFLGVIKTLVNVIETKDEYTRGHSERVTQISLAIGREMGLSGREMETLHVSALLHDIGKIAVPEEILKKAASLTAEEYAWIKRHPTIGSSLVRHIQAFDEIIKGILYHHERFDGKGYPSGTDGKDIPLVARIIAVADAYDAMTSDRPYRGKMSEERALYEILQGGGGQFDEAVVRAFHEAFKKKKITAPPEKFPSLMQLRKLT